MRKFSMECLTEMLDQRGRDIERQNKRIKSPGNTGGGQSGRTRKVNLVQMLEAKQKMKTATSHGRRGRFGTFYKADLGKGNKNGD